MDVQTYIVRMHVELRQLNNRIKKLAQTVNNNCEPINKVSVTLMALEEKQLSYMQNYRSVLLARIEVCESY